MVGSATEKNGKWTKAQTKVAVWDALRIGVEPEKKLCTAEIEIYRLVASNGVFGNGNVVNQNLGLGSGKQKL